jgi:fucose permease
MSFFLFIYLEKIPLLKDKSNGATKKAPTSRTMPQEGSKVPMFIFYTLMLLFDFSYVWMEVSFTGYIAVYAVKGLGLEKRVAILCTSVFYGCFGLGRFLAIPSSTLLSQRTILITNQALIAFGLAGLYFVHVDPSLLWIGTAIVGLGTSSMFPTQIIWFSRHIKFQGTASGVLHTGVSLGAMLGPTVTGFFFQTYGHQWLVYLMLMACGVNVVIYAALEVLVHYNKAIFKGGKATITDTECEQLNKEEV